MSAIAKAIGERLSTVLMSLLLLSYLSVAGICLYWYLDDQHPIEEVQGRFIGWDSVNPRVGWVEWSGVRVRSCDGMNYRMIVNSIQEDLSTRKIIYNGEIKNPERKREAWQSSFELPPQFYAYQEHPKRATYRARWEYFCNLWQAKIQPLIVTPPDIEFEIPSAETPHDQRIIAPVKPPAPKSGVHQ